MENLNLSEFINWSCLLTEIHALPRAVAHIAQEINEAERPGCMPGGRAIKVLRDQISPKISDSFYLFGYLRGGSIECEDPRRRSNSFQNPYATRGLIY